MADEQIPRNKLGQTYDEWVEAQQIGEQEVIFETNIEPWDIIIGMDKSKAIPGIRMSDMGVIVGRVTRPFVPTVTGYSQEASAQYGTTYQGVSYGSKSFQIPITVLATDKEILNERLRTLANVVINPSSKKETSIVFGEEPDIVYYGHFENISEPVPLNETAWDHSVTLTFVASDPRGFYNSENEQVDLSSGNVTFTPRGTAFADPIITIEPKKDAKPLTQFGYTINKNEKVMVGNSTDSVKMFDEKPVVFSDKMESMNQWERIIPPKSDPSSVLPFELARDALLTDGSIHVNPAFGASAITNRIDGSDKNSWSTKMSKIKNPWYGPVAISKTNLQASIGKNGYWETQLKIHNIKKYSRAVQVIEIYFLDEKSKRRARWFIRSNDKGQRSYSSLRFGTDYDNESKSIRTGLGYAIDYGLKEDYIDNKDVTVSVPGGKDITIQKPYTSSKTVKEYHYYRYSGTTRWRESWTTTETTTFNPKTKKYSTKISYSAIKTERDNSWSHGHHWHVERYTRSKYNDFKPITNWGEMQRLSPGNVQYWKKGQRKHLHDNPDEALVSGVYKNNSTKKTMIGKNITHINITQTYYNGKGQSTENKSTLKYYNGNGNRTTKDGKKYINNFGVLAEARFTHKTTNSDKPSTSTQKEMVDYPDKSMAGTYDDVFILLTFGRDKKGFYWSVDELASDGSSKSTSLVPLTYDKRPDLHKDYDFTLDKMAIHFAKAGLPEDNNVWKEGDDTGENDDKYRPAKSYSDNYLTFFDVKVTKLLEKPNKIDLITLKQGQKAQFDTYENLFTIDGKKRQELVNIDSTWPQIRGGVPNNIKITPDPGDDYVVRMEYRPTIL